MFGFPFRVRTPSSVSKAQLVSVLVAFAATARLRVLWSPVPTIVPAIATFPPFGQAFVTENVVLIAIGAATDAVTALPGARIATVAPRPKSDAPRLDTASMSAASLAAADGLMLVARSVDELHAATVSRRPALQIR